MNWKRYMTAVSVALMAGFLMAPAAEKSDRAEVLFESARQKETLEGNLEAAIQQYKEIVSSYGGNRAVAAKALLQIGRCYEKLGSTEARKAYERVLSNYADQQEITAEARVRLAALAPAPRGDSPRALTTRLVWTHFSFAISPDGRYIASNEMDTGDLALKDLTTGEQQRLTSGGNWNTDYAWDAAFSPDGKQVAYGWYANNVWELRILPVHAPSGARPRVLMRNPEFHYGEHLEWSPDGKQILVALSRKDKSNQIALVSVADGSVRVLKSLEWRYPEKLSFSPDGRSIAYDVPVRKDTSDRDIFLLATDGSQEIPLVQGPTKDSAPVWTPDGNAIVFISDRSGSTGAWMLRVAGGKPLGNPELLKNDMGSLTPVGITRDGSYYYQVNAVSSDSYTAEIDPATGKVMTPPALIAERYLGANTSAAWSPDGQYLAFFSQRTKLKGFLTLVIRSVNSGEEREVLTNLTHAGPLRWFPDGRSVVSTAFNVDGDSQRSLHRIDVRTGKDLIKQTIEAAIWKNTSVSPDGKKIYYQKRDFQTFTSRILVYDVETGEEKELYKSSPQGVDFALSRDGKQLALALNDGAAQSASLHVMPAEGGATRELFKDHRTGIVGIDWAPGGRYLVFGGATEPDLWRISVEGGAPQKLEIATRAESESLWYPTIHPDGRQIAFVVMQKKWELWAMQNFLPARLTAAK